MASPSPNLLAPSPVSSFPAFEDIVNSESALLKHVSRNYAHTSFDTFTSSGYVDFAYTVENMRWTALAQLECEPLPRREMDRLWINIVMEFWVKMAWCWEGDVEGIVIALLEREDGKGVEEMWEDRKMEYPELDTSLCYPMIGHNGIFEDYLDLGIRAVINPEIRCYLEKMEDGTNYDSEIGEGVSNLEFAELGIEEDGEIDDGAAFEEAIEEAIEKVKAKIERERFGDKDGDENVIEIKKEDEGSGNKDGVDNEAVVIKQEKDIKQKKDIKQEKDESAQNIPADTQATISTPGIGITPPNPPSRLGNTILRPEAAIPASHYAARPTMDGPSAPGPSASRASNNLGEVVERFSIEESPRITLRVIALQNPIKKEPYDMFPHLANAPSSSIFRGEDAVQELLPKAAPKVTTAPKVETTGLSGSFKLIDGVSHFIPRNEDPAPKDSICDVFDMAYEDACKVPGFWEEPMWNGVQVYKMSPLTLAQHYAAHKKAKTSHAKTFIFGPTPVYQPPTAATIPAPVFQAQTRAYNPAPLFQARTGAHSSAPTFRAVSYPSPNTAPVFQANFYAANYSTPYGPPGFQAPPTISRSAPNFHAGNYSTPNTAPGFQAPPPVSRFASNYNDPNYIHLNYLAAIPAPPIFINLTAADFKEMYASTFVNLTAADFDKMEVHNSLAVPKIRQDPRIKAEGDDDFKMESERCYSDSILARKRARDVDSEDEELNLERPRKFSG
ncbi:hypothetical protein GMDG_03388 [Pseudogymnoascus destructans 20631-21]|uniref:Uncharacterized protein n=2 Tax=Pseudogymnoascus destructans TaxID=655981 RepID=L8G9J8_PSED2|nr:hypothetical protein GMDG_03388 [Pseudogymnoascus destructans 20631-21]